MYSSPKLSAIYLFFFFVLFFNKTNVAAMNATRAKDKSERSRVRLAVYFVVIVDVTGFTWLFCVWAVCMHTFELLRMLCVCRCCRRRRLSGQKRFVSGILSSGFVLGSSELSDTRDGYGLSHSVEGRCIFLCIRTILEYMQEMVVCLTLA